MQFLLGLIILSQVWILVRKLIEVLDELVENVLFAIAGVQELQELHLEARITNAGLLSLQANIPENTLHLTLIVLGKVSPQLNNHWFEVIIDVISIWHRLYLCSA